MEITPVGFVMLAVCVLIIARPVRWGLVIFGAILPLRTAAAFNLPMLGDSSVILSQLAIIALIVGVAIRANLRRGALITAAQNPAIIVFGLFVAYAAISAIFMPRFFEGSVAVYSLDREATGLTTLKPTTGNITQSAYLMSEFFLFWLLAHFITMKGGVDNAARMLNALTLFHILFAIIDMIPGSGAMLEFIRTANYSIHVNQEVAGFRRIIGSYSEPSALATASTLILGYNFIRFLQTRGLWFFFASVFTLGCILLSFSSTGYAALGVLAGIWVLSILLGMLRQSGLGREQVVGVLLGSAGLLVLSAFLFVDGLNTFAVDMFNRLIGTKLESDSGVERSGWNAQALQNAIDTFGFGVGLGGARTSSLVTALLSNTGVFGTIGFVAFLILSSLRRFPRPRRKPSDAGADAGSEQAYAIKRRLFAAARAAVVAGLVAGAISASTVDQGAMFFTYTAVGAGLIAAHRNQSRTVKSSGAQSIGYFHRTLQPNFILAKGSGAFPEQQIG